MLFTAGPLGCLKKSDPYRSALLERFFSRARVVNFEGTLRGRVELLCDRLDQHRRSEELVDLQLLFTCFATDVLTAYALPQSFDLLSTPDLCPTWSKALSIWVQSYHWFKYCPYLWHVVRAAPARILTALFADPRIAFDLQHIRDWAAVESIDDFGNTIEDIEGKPVAREKTGDRFWQEVQSSLLLGTSTVSKTLTAIVVRLTEMPAEMAQLRSELDTLLDPALSSVQQLENLSYLRAIIQEGLRLSSGNRSHHLQVARGEHLHYRGQVIPGNTAIAISAMLFNGNLYPQPYAFVPARWLDQIAPPKLLLLPTNFYVGAE